MSSNDRKNPFHKSEVEKLEEKLKLALSEKAFRVKKENEMKDQLELSSQLIRDEREKSGKLTQELLASRERVVFLESRNQSLEQLVGHQKQDLDNKDSVISELKTHLAEARESQKLEIK